MLSGSKRKNKTFSTKREQTFNRLNLIFIYLYVRFLFVDVLTK